MIQLVFVCNAGVIYIAIQSCNLTSPWSDHVGVIFTSTMSAGRRSSTDLVVTSPCLQDCMRVGSTLWTKPFPLVRNRTRAEGLTGHSVRLLHLRCTFSHLFRILKLCFAMKVLRCCALSISKVAHGPKKVLSENCECDCSRLYILIQLGFFSVS